MNLFHYTTDLILIIYNTDIYLFVDVAFITVTLNKKNMNTSFFINSLMIKLFSMKIKDVFSLTLKVKHLNYNLSKLTFNHCFMKCSLCKNKI